MSDVRRIIANNIKAARKAKGWTQTDLAVASGVSFRGLQDIETAKHTPRQETMDALAGALGITQQDLLNTHVNSSKRVSGKADSITAIVTALPSLNNSQLELVLELIDGFGASAAGSAKGNAG